MSLWSTTIQHSAGQNIVVSFCAPTDVSATYTLSVDEPLFSVVFISDGASFTTTHDSPDFMQSLAAVYKSENETEHTLKFTTYVDGVTNASISYEDSVQLSNAYAIIEE